ncbi:MAG TPA: YciI family protein [Polyangiaceae bacterium]|nr:YciI family protein [Polyangiaceae bacterium]
MKFIVLVTANKDTALTAAEFERYETGALPPCEEFVKMIAYQEELVKAGVLVAGEGLRPSSLGARMTFGKDGKTSTKDGPFTESKELIVGFSILQVKSRDEALAWVSRAPFPEGTKLELRQLFTDDDFASVDPTGELREHDAKLREQAEKQHAKS